MSFYSSFSNRISFNSFVRFSFFFLCFVMMSNYWWTISNQESSRIILITTLFSIFAIRLVAVIIIFLGVFFPHTGTLTQFINRLSAFYFIYYIWLESSGIVYRFSELSSKFLLELVQEDSLLFRLFFIYATLTLAIYFFGIADRFFISKLGIIEFSILLIFIHFGGLFARRRHTFIDRLIALEIVTLASYVLVTFERTNRFSTYAGVQYFVIGSLPSAILLLAFSIFYIQSGARAFQDLDLFYNTVNTNSFIGDSGFFKNYFINNLIRLDSTIGSTFFYSFINSPFCVDQLNSIVDSIDPINSRSVMAIIFLFFNFFFKLTVAPFHVWAPSVYGKAPVASVAFLSIYSKILIFFIRFKFLNSFLHVFSSIVIIVFITLGLFTIFVGMIGAFSEKTIKSFFVYSSIGHVGFILIGFGLFTLEGSAAAITYLAIYILSSFVRWFLLLILGRSKTYLTQFAELQYTNPILASRFAFLIFSISGIPPLGGFFIKLDILSSIQDNSHFFINYMLFFFTVISFFYYLRIIKIIFFDNQEYARSIPSIKFYEIYRFDYSYNNGRVWLRSLIIIILAFYLCFIQKPLIVIQSLALSSVY